MRSSSHRASSIDYFFSDEAYVFELCSLNWLRLTQQLPQRLFEFGAIFHGKHLYLLGGTLNKSQFFSSAF